MAEDDRRAQLAEALEQSTESQAAPVTTPQDSPQGDVVGQAQSGETPEQAAERLRDDKGRFAAGKLPEKKDAQQPVQDGLPAQKPRPARPSTWRKEHWDRWDKLDPELAEYLVERESQYAKGVSTYKTEWENARPLVDALAPFQPLLQQHGVNPAQWIQSLGQAQMVLATGTPQQKLDMLQRVAHQYQIPIQSLLQGPGQQQVGPDGQPIQPAYDPRVDALQRELQQVSGQWNHFQTEQQRAAQAAIDGEIAAFAADPQYPHFEQVRETMAGLLQAGLAKDLKSAYPLAIRHHDDIWQSEQKAKQEADEKARREQAATAAKNAKSAGASVRSATPSGAQAPKGGSQDRRSQLSDALDASVGGRL